MRCKLSLGVFAAVALCALAGTTVAQASSAAKSNRLTGLTGAGINAVVHGDVKSNRTAMAAQASVALLQQASKVGSHAPSSLIHLTIALKLRNEERLADFLQAVQDPRSPSYHQFLTLEQFTARYGPSEAQVEAVTQFLRQYGITVTDVSSNRILIHTEAPTRNYEHAFGIAINDYSLNGREFFSTMDRPKLPTALAGVVQNIVGLNNAVQLRAMHHIKPLNVAEAQANATPAPPPLTSAYYRPKQIQTAYQWPSVTDASNGAGVTVAILTADSANLPVSDYTGFWDAFGLPGHTVNIIPVKGSTRTDGTIETLLDMEWSGTMGPGEILDVYMGGDPTTSTFVDVYNQLVTDNSAQVATTSWSAPEAAWGTDAEAADAIFEEASAQGISIFAAAGDNGASAGTGQSNVAEFPSVDTYVTAANGTELRADKNGNYISERAWADTGGAISKIFEEPDWQVGPGVPDNGWRNNSDMALNAGGAWPYLLLYQNTWYLVWGTSAVAPIFAGLFAIGVSENGRIGQSNKVIYNDVNADHYATDFRDVTTGCNGKLPDGSPSCAATNWDHPTGWGSPRATSLLSHLGIQGPHGKLAGTVTDASTGQPVVGALVTLTPDHYFRNTDGSGNYSVVVPAGNYTATVTDFDYQTQSVSVTIGDGQTTTQDFSLAPAPEATISGSVTDGSGHGYGLYAEIRITTPDFHGTVADLWTDPKTGHYSVKLPQGHDYTLEVLPAFDGYNPGSATLTLNSDTTQNIALTIAPTCSAPGYGFVAGFGEDFNGGFPPTGWTVETPTDNGFTAWQLNTDYGDRNYTGGSGTAAEASDDKGGAGAYDTRLISPAIPVSSLPADPILRYAANYNGSYETDSELDLDLSSDGGSQWQSLLQWKDTEYCGHLYSLPGCNARVDLGPFMPASGSIQLRWRYHDPDASAWDWYAQIDDVRIGTCKMVAGGLVMGQVSDANTGGNLVGARVSDDRGNLVKTVANADPNLPAGTYILFTPSGKRTLTASDGYYEKATAAIAMTDNAVLAQNFSLNAGRIAGDPDRYDVSVKVNGQDSETLTLGNEGSAPLHYRIVEDNPPFRANADGTQAAAMPAQARGDAAIRPSAAATGGGSVVASFATDLLGTYGLGVDRNAADLWVGSVSNLTSGGDDRDHQFLFDGSATGATIDVSGLSGIGAEGDMAFDDNTGTLWQIGSIANTFCINELDPVSRQVTGRKICPDLGVYQIALAYDPTTDTWFTVAPDTQTVYHMDASGRVLDSKSVDIKAVALAYNTATGHLFVLASGDKHDIYVLDAKNGYKLLDTYDVQGLEGGGGAGLDYDCNGNLWATDSRDNKVFEIRSGETGWCAFKKIPWLTETPMSGTIAAGASAQVTLVFDGAGQKASTTSESQFLVQSDTPYGDGLLTVPLTVTWEPSANNPPVASDGTLSTKQNTAASGTLTATDPDGDPLKFSIVDQPQHGSVTLDDATTGAYTYTPNKGFSGKDSFTFKANDGEADSNVATINVTVKSSGGGGGGGGATAPLGLLLLAFTGLAAALIRRRR